MGSADFKFDAVLDINDPDFGKKLRAILDVKDGEPVEFVTPQFTRTDGREPDSAPPLFNFDALPGLSDEALKEIGCQKWNEPDASGNVIWLYPAEWYDAIPDGHIVTDINNIDEPFRHGETDNDVRFGALAFGFRRRADEAQAIAAEDAQRESDDNGWNGVGR